MGESAEREEVRQETELVDFPLSVSSYPGF
jgi:hypothetical protein